jgi:succinate dehydrogenase hydrophobic anchor subunit
MKLVAARFWYKSAMSAILLATLNARYIHASLGLRYLLANLGDLRSETTLRMNTPSSVRRLKSLKIC